MQESSTDQMNQPSNEHPSLLIEVEHLSRVIETRSRRTVILDNLSFRVSDQSLFAVTGPSGSGKSTLLNLLTGIDRPSSGRVLFAGEELRALSESGMARWRGKHVGVVFQFFQLIPTLTAAENILLALELGRSGLPRRTWRGRALHCLEMVGLEQHSQQLPGELSGGEQQRVAIARALATDPPLLVADEPTGNLDSRTARQVFDILAGLTKQGKTVIYVTHNRELAARASARIELLDGRIAAQENAEAIIVPAQEAAS